MLPLPTTTISLPDIPDEELPICSAVLIIDDEEQIRTLLSNVLCANGYIILTTATAETALEIISSFHDRLSAVIADIHLQPGGMDGVSLCREIRKANPGLGILAICGGFFGPVLDELTDMDVTILRKPFGIEDLVAALTSLRLTRQIV